MPAKQSKSVSITYFVHGTTTDNERSIATGWQHGKLSTLGKQQSRDLKKLIAGKKFDTIFCSDLHRAVNSANLTFPGQKIIQDAGLRECDYGNLTGGPEGKVKAAMEQRVSSPFPKGESYMDVEKRMREFVDFLRTNYAGKHIAIVAHQAPQLALDVILKLKTWQQAIAEDWRRKTPKEWQPGWEYEA